MEVEKRITNESKIVGNSWKDKPYIRYLNDTTGITLVALVVTIVVLLILAGITITYLFGDNSILNKAKSVAETYETEREKEVEGFNNLDRYMKVATNKKPQIEVLKCSNRTASSMKIIAMATDLDGKNLTYKLYVGTTRENLVEQTEKKENITQGTEVEWQISVIDATSIYYYKIIVLDQYGETDSGIRETNNAPVLGTVTIEKDLDEATGNWVKAKVTATDAENDKLTYTFKMWKKEESVNVEELVQQEPTKVITKENVNAGKETELTIRERTRRIYRLCI